MSSQIELHFEGSVHHYQFSNSPTIFAELDSMIRLKYPLRFNIHSADQSKNQLQYSYIDDDGDQCTISNEIEMAEALRVCQPLIVSLVDLSISESTAHSSSQTMKSGTSPTTPFVAGTPPSVSVPAFELSESINQSDIPDLLDYSSDEELYEAARVFRPSTQSVPDNRLQTGVEMANQTASVDSVSQDALPPVSSSETQASSVISDSSAAASYATVSASSTSVSTVVTSNSSINEDNQKTSSAVSEQLQNGSSPVAPSSPSGAPALSQSLDQSLFRSLSSGSSDESLHQSNSLLAVHLASFFSEPTVITTINHSVSQLLPVINVLPLFLYKLCKIHQANNHSNPPAAPLSEHPLCKFIFARANLHYSSVCSNCSAEPIIGPKFDCSGPVNPAALHPEQHSCRVSLCERCAHDHEQSTSHLLLRYEVQPFDLDEEDVASPSVNQSSKRPFKKKLSVLYEDVKRLMQKAVNTVEVSINDAFPKRGQSSSSSNHPSSSSNGPRQCATNRCVAPGQVERAQVSTEQPPARASMDATQPSAPVDQAPTEWKYAKEYQQIIEMGLASTLVERQTVRELLIGSKGNVDQVVQWMMEKIEK